MPQREGHEAQYQKMIETPIRPLIISLAIPTIISMLVSSLYNMADTFFVSQLGTSASGAVGVVFPIMVVIQAIGFTFGTGSGSLISRRLGAHKNEEANEIASTGFFSALLLGACITVFGLSNLDTVMGWLGATDTILPYARAYARCILLGAPVMAASFVMNNILRAQGKARLSMVGLTLGGVLNIILDPIFIFAFELGTAGAAIATLISQCTSFCVLLSFFFRGKALTPLKPGAISRRGIIYYQIISTGLPSFIRQSMSSVAIISLNRVAGPYGDAAISAMAIVNKIFAFIFATLLGFGQGYMPVVGYNYGAKRFDRVKKAYAFFLKVGMSVMAGLSFCFFLLAPRLITAFVPGDPEVTRIGAQALRFQCLVLPLQPVAVSCNMTFQSIGKSWRSTFLASLRQGIFFLPLILLLPRTGLGVVGVELTQPLSDLLSFLVCVPFAVNFWKSLSQNPEKENE